MTYPATSTTDCNNDRTHINAACADDPPSVETVHHGSVDADKLLNDLCVVYGYCLSPDDQQRIIADPPQTIDAFTDAVIIAEGLDPVRMDTERRRELRRMVAAAFGEQISPVGPKRRASWSERGHRD